MGYLYSGFVVACGAVLAAAITAAWERFKISQGRKETPLRLNRNGVYVPWGILQKLQRIGTIACVVWLIWLVAMTTYGVRYTRTHHQEPEIVSLLTAGIL